MYYFRGKRFKTAELEALGGAGKLYETVKSPDNHGQSLARRLSESAAAVGVVAKDYCGAPIIPLEALKLDSAPFAEGGSCTNMALTEME